MTNMNSGYTGYSMSNRAVEAYENGEKPISKWTKTELLDIASECDLSVAITDLKKLTAKELRSICLSISSWHHTSSYCNSTDFYSFDEEKLQQFSKKDIEQIIGERKAKKEPQPEIWKCQFLEWSGSRRHPHATEVTAIGTLKGSWLYLDDGSKKSINARGFAFIERIK